MIGSFPVDVDAMGSDLLIISAHRFGGLKGTGVGSSWIGRDRGARAGTCPPDIHWSAPRFTTMRNRLIDHPTVGFANNVSIALRYIEKESIFLMPVVFGSACASAPLEPSHALIAYGFPHEGAHGSLRPIMGF